MTRHSATQGKFRVTPNYIRAYLAKREKERPSTGASVSLFQRIYTNRERQGVRNELHKISTRLSYVSGGPAAEIYGRLLLCSGRIFQKQQMPSRTRALISTPCVSLERKVFLLTDGSLNVWPHFYFFTYFNFAARICLCLRLCS